MVGQIDRANRFIRRISYPPWVMILVIAWATNLQKQLGRFPRPIGTADLRHWDIEIFPPKVKCSYGTRV